MLLKSPSKTGSVGEEESYLLQSTEMRSLILKNLVRIHCVSQLVLGDGTIKKVD